MTIVYCKLNTYRRDPPSSKSRPPEAPCLNVLGSVHLVSALALSAATGLLRTFNATRGRRDERDSSNAPAPGTTRDAKDSAPMRGIGGICAR